ncbi:hypothetical protein ACFLYT_01280 [Nanoarchaeota archaeon]
MVLVVVALFSSPAMAAPKFLEKFTNGIGTIKSPKDLDGLTTAQKIVAYPAAFFKVPKLLINTLILIGIFIFAIIAFKVENKTHQILLILVGAILGIALGWNFAIKNPGLYWWQWNALKNFAHFKVLVNAGVIAAALIFLSGWLLKDHLNTGETKWGSRILIVIIALMMATNPFKAGVTWEGPAPGGLGSGDHYYYIWDTPTFLEWKYIGFGNKEREDFSYLESEFNEYVNKIKNNEEAVMPGEPIDKKHPKYDLKLYPVLRGKRLMMFIGASLMFAVLFLTQLNVGGDQKKWLDWAIAIFLAGNLVHSTNTGVDTIILAGQAIFSLVLAKQMMGKADGAHQGTWKFVWIVIAIGLVLLLSALVFPGRGILSKMGITEAAIEDHTEKLGLTGEEAAAKAAEIKAKTEKEIGDEVGLMSWIKAILNKWWLFAAIPLGWMLVSMIRGKSEFGKTSRAIAGRSLWNIANMLAGTANATLGQIPVFERFWLGYNSPKGQMHVAFKKNRILIWTLFNYMKRLEIFFGKISDVGEAGDRYEAEGDFSGAKVNGQSCMEITAGTEDRNYKDPEEVRRKLKEYRSGTPLDIAIIKEIVNKDLDSIKRKNVDGLIDELDKTFKEKGIGKSKINDADKIYLKEKISSAVDKRLDDEKLERAVFNYFFAVLNKNKEGEKGWCGYTSEVLEHVDNLMRLFDKIIKREDAAIVHKKIIELSNTTSEIDTIRESLNNAKTNYEEFFSARCAHNYIRSIYLELNDQYNSGSHTYLFARKGAKWNNNKTVKYSIYGNKGDYDKVIEVDKYGRSLKDPSVQLKDPRQIDAQTDINDLSTWMDHDWRSLLEDMRWGLSHQYSRSLNDYIEAIKYRAEIRGELLEKVYSDWGVGKTQGRITKENPAFDKHALEDPGDWTPGSVEKREFYGGYSEIPTDKIKDPMLSTMGMTSYFVEKMRVIITDDERRKEFLSRLPADSGGENKNSIVTTLDKSAEKKENA